MYFSRRKPTIPALLRTRDRWVRYTSQKVPLTAGGHAASSTDPTTWSTYEAVNASTVGAGVGFVLNGDGIGCYDLDHCFDDGQLTEAARRFLRSKDGFYAEVSPSGDGVHLWVHAESQPGWKRTIDGLHVEFYTRGRYLTVTGKHIDLLTL